MSAIDCLKAHNEYREKHGVPPLVLNEDISKGCQEYAEILVKKSNLEHARQNKYGENLFCMTSTDVNFNVSASEAVHQWYNEIAMYKFSKPMFTPGTGHFTQVVWKNSKELGVGYAKYKGKVVIVARYYPAGNFLDQFAENVFPPHHQANNAPNDSKSVNVSELKNLTIEDDSPRESSGDFNEDCLRAHNQYRKLHKVPLLELDQEMCKVSQRWAEEICKAGVLNHSSNKTYGENIFMMSSTDPSFSIDGAKAVDNWYNEISTHNFNAEPSGVLRSGHFTQVVWKDSKKLGVGYARKNGANYVVCNYFPRGNFIGQFIGNVTRPLK